MISVPEGHYDELTEEDTEEGPKYCLADQELIEVGDKIYVDPSLGNDDGTPVVVVSYWHSECWDAAEEILDRLDGREFEGDKETHDA